MEFQILDYTSSYLITISNGQSKIQDGTYRIIHPIDLKQYDVFVKQTKTYIERNIPESNPFYPILNEEIMQALNLIQSIAPLDNNYNNNKNNNNENDNNSENNNNYKLRFKRSINVIGSAWKYIAGTADHDDFEMLEFNMLELNKNNNNQIVINQNVNDRLNNVTKLINQMSNAIGQYNYIINEIMLTLQSRIRIIKEQLLKI